MLPGLEYVLTHFAILQAVLGRWTLFPWAVAFDFVFELGTWKLWCADVLPCSVAAMKRHRCPMSASMLTVTPLPHSSCCLSTWLRCSCATSPSVIPTWFVPDDCLDSCWTELAFKNCSKEQCASSLMPCLPTANPVVVLVLVTAALMIAQRSFCIWGSILYLIKENRISSWIHGQRSINSLHHQLHYIITYKYLVEFKTSDIFV